MPEENSRTHLSGFTNNALHVSSAARSSQSMVGRGLGALLPLLLLARTICEHHLTRYFVIGDLHGDAGCAWQWIKRTGLIDRVDGKMVWLGTRGEALYFMGDYVDKGREGRQTLELVRELTNAVTSLAAGPECTCEY